jgi:hypothetical protein
MVMGGLMFAWSDCGSLALLVNVEVIWERRLLHVVVHVAVE